MTLAEARADLDPATETGAAEASMESLYAPLEAQAAEIMARLEAGEDFETLLSAFGQDPVMQDPESCYYVSADTELWSREFMEAALALRAPGDISAPTRSPGGVHILRYVEAVSEGKVPLAEIRDTLAARTLAKLRDDIYQAQLTDWAEELHVVYYPERLAE